MIPSNALRMDMWQCAMMTLTQMNPNALPLAQMVTLKGMDGVTNALKTAKNVLLLIPAKAAMTISD